MVLRNVPSTATFEEQRQEINLLAADVNALPTTTDLSTDTSPQLSADLDLNGHNISGTGISISPDTISAGAYNFVGSGSPGAGNPSGNLVWNGSDNKLYFGDAYLTRSSNGVGWIGSSGTIFLSAANGITVTNEAATETYFTLNAGSNTALYHNTTIKLNTTVSGIEVFGDIDVSGDVSVGNTVTATGFTGNLTGNVTGNLTGNTGDIDVSGDVSVGNTVTGTSSVSGATLQSNGTLLLSRGGSNYLIMGRQTGTAGNTLTIGADGSASFAGTVGSSRVNLEGTSTENILAGYAGSTANSLLTADAKVYLGNISGGGNIVLDGTDGSATFGGVLQGDQRVVINGAGGKTGSADTLLNYAGDGSTVTASLTADGAASFAGTIKSTDYPTTGYELESSGALGLNAVAGTSGNMFALAVGGTQVAGITGEGIATFAGDVVRGTYAVNSNYCALRDGQLEIGRNTNDGNLSLLIGTRYNGGTSYEAFSFKTDGRATFADYVTSNEGFYVAQTVVPDGSSIFKSWLGASTYVDILDNGSASFDGTISDSIGPLRKLGSNTQSGAYTLVATDAGKFVAQSSNSAAVTVPNGVFAAGDMVTVVNLTATNINIVQGSGLDLNFTADGTTGTRTLAQKGVCTILFVSSGTSFISGSGLS